MTAAYVSLAALLVAVGKLLTAIGQKNTPAILFQRRRDPGLLPAVGADLAGSATPEEARMNTIKLGDLVLPQTGPQGDLIGRRMNTIKLGDLVLPPGDDRPWRVLDLYQGKAQIEFVGEAWTRIKTVPAGDLRIDPCERSTTTNA